MTDSSPVLRKLHNWQMLLLDLTRANRLLYFKVDRASSVPITSPAPFDLFMELVPQGKRLTFQTADEKVVFEEEPEERHSRGSAAVEAATSSEASAGRLAHSGGSQCQLRRGCCTRLRQASSPMAMPRRPCASSLDYCEDRPPTISSRA